MSKACGGIYPIKGTIKTRPPAAKRICCVCGKDNASHFCQETEVYLHAVCAIAFLQTEDGKIVIKHGHHIHIHFQDE